MATERAVIGVMGEGLWARLRATILAQQRLDAFAFAPDNPGAANEWLRTLLDDPGLLGEVAAEVALRALRTGAEAVNFLILTRLGGGNPLPLAELAGSTGLPRLTLSERVDDLVRAGLAARDLEHDAVTPTPGTRGFLGLVEALRERLSEAARRELPSLLATDRSRQ